MEFTSLIPTSTKKPVMHRMHMSPLSWELEFTGMGVHLLHFKIGFRPRWISTGRARLNEFW